MTPKSFLDERYVLDCLNVHYALKLNSLKILPLGADIHAQVFEGKDINQTSYFIKMKFGLDHDIGVTIASLLKDAGIKSIISPIKTKHGQLSQLVGDFTLIVYPFVNGQNGFTRRLTKDQWIALGSALRKVHSLILPASVRQQVRKETYSAKWREAVLKLYDTIDIEKRDDEIAENLIQFMKEHKNVILRLVNRAEQLSQKIMKASAPDFVLCHSDIHGGNVLLEGKNLYIVDWDHPIMAPKERDLMFIGGGVANVWNLLEEEQFFYQGYGEVEINKAILSYYRYERIVEDIAIYNESLLLNKEASKNRLEMYQQFLDLFQKDGVVDIAFRTDEMV